jgi:hypothetical protein
MGLPSTRTERSEPTTANGIMDFRAQMVLVLTQMVSGRTVSIATHSDPLVESDFIVIVLFRINGIQPDLIILQLCSNLSVGCKKISFCPQTLMIRRHCEMHPFFESLSFLKSQGIRLGDDRNNVGDLRQFP